MKVTNQMRLSNPLLSLSLGTVLAAASCTLITDVDRSKIPDGQAGAPGAGAATPPAPATNTKPAKRKPIEAVTPPVSVPPAPPADKKKEK